MKIWCKKKNKNFIKARNYLIFSAIFFVTSAVVFSGWYFLALRAEAQRDAAALVGQGTYLTRHIDNDADTPRATGFSSSEGLALDEAGHRLFVADMGNNRVLVFNLDANNDLLDRTADYVLGQSAFITSSTAAGFNGMNEPYDVEFNYVSNTLYVADSGNNRVLVYDVAAITNGENAIYVLGQADENSTGSATTQTGLSYPMGLSYATSTNLLFVSDANNNRIMVFHLGEIANGENAVNVLGQAGFVTSAAATTQNGLDSPWGLALNTTSSILYAADYSNYRVLVFDVLALADGENAVSVLGQADFVSSDWTYPPTQSSLVSPAGLAFNSANNSLYVSDYGDYRVLIFDASSVSNNENALYVLGQSDFTGLQSGATKKNMCTPSGLAYNSVSGTLFVADECDNRVQIFNVTSVTDGEDANDLLGQTDNNGEPVWTASRDNNIQAGAGGLNGPYGLSLDYIHHRLFVCDGVNNRVLVFNLDSNDNLEDNAADYVLGQPDFYSVYATTTQDGLDSPSYVFYHSASNTLYVSDTDNNRVMIYDVASITNGENAINVIGRESFTDKSAWVAGNNDDSFYTVGGMAVNYGSSTLFVVDRSASRVLVFDISTITDGEAATHVLGQTDFTGQGSATSQSRLKFPWDVYFNSASNTLYVADTGNHRVMVFDVGTITDGEQAVSVLGQTTFAGGSSSLSQSRLYAPYALFYEDIQKLLFVSDSSNHRVMVFDAASSSIGENAVNVLGQTDFITAATTIGQNALFTPYGLAYSATGTILYVADNYWHRIVAYKFVNISTVSLAVAETNNAYSATVSTAGEYGTLSFEITAGALPTGLSLATATGIISGTPSATGDFTFTIKATETETTGGIYYDTVEYTISVTEGVAPASPVTESSSYYSPPSSTPVIVSPATSTPISSSTIAEVAQVIVPIKKEITPPKKQLLVRQPAKIPLAKKKTPPKKIPPKKVAVLPPTSTVPVVPPLPTSTSPLPYLPPPGVPVAEPTPPALDFGVVQNKFEEPLSDVKVTLYNAFDEVATTGTIREGYNPTETSSSGSYGFVVQDNRYYLTAEKEGYLRRETVSYHIDDKVDLKITLIRKPPGLFEGIIPGSVLGEKTGQVVKNIGANLETALDLTKQGLSDLADVLKEAKKDPEARAVASKVVAPTVVTVSAVGAVAFISWSDLWPFLRLLFLQPLLLLGLKKRKKWGEVYNALNKRPIDLAVVRLVDSVTGKILQTRVTDAAGRFVFIANPGRYKITVAKHDYVFPGVILKDQREDGRRADLYHGEEINVTTDRASITVNIPLDPVGAVKPLWRLRFQRFLRFTQVAFSSVGIIVTGISLYIAPEWYVWALFLAHIIIFFLFRLLAIPKKPKGWGIVYDVGTKKPVARAVARLFDSRFNKLVDTEITDNRGRYSFLAGESTYYVSFEHRDYEPAKTESFALKEQTAAAVTRDMGLVKKTKVDFINTAI